MRKALLSLPLLVVPSLVIQVGTEIVPNLINPSGKRD